MLKHVCLWDGQNIKSTKRQSAVMGNRWPAEQEVLLSLFDETLYLGPNVHIDHSEIWTVVTFKRESCQLETTLAVYCLVTLLKMVSICLRLTDYILLNL